MQCERIVLHPAAGGHAPPLTRQAVERAVAAPHCMLPQLRRSRAQLLRTRFGLHRNGTAEPQMKWRAPAYLAVPPASPHGCHLSGSR